MDNEIFTVKTKIAATLSAADSSEVVPIFDYVPYSKSGYQVLDEYLEVENLKAVSWIYSLAVTPFPVFNLEDSESKQLLTALNLEWQSARKQMDVVIKIDEGNWQRIASYSLLNNSPYPYREYSLGNHALGSNSMIGLQIKDVGYGLLTVTNGLEDKVTVFGDLTRVVTARKLVTSFSNIENSITSNASIVVPSNSARKAISFFNSSDTNVYLDVDSSLTINNCMVKLEPGDYYEPPILYAGAYYAIATSNAAIDIREFV